MPQQIPDEPAADRGSPPAVGGQPPAIGASDPPPTSGSTPPVANQVAQDRSPNLSRNPQTLPSERFYDGDLTAVLLSVLRSTTQARATRQLLGPLVKANPATISTTVSEELQRPNRSKLFNDVLDVGADGAPIASVSTVVESELWKYLQCTNSVIPPPTPADNTQGPPSPPSATGRIVVIRSLTPFTMLQLLVSHRSHFDLERLLSTFLNKGGSQGFRPQQTLGNYPLILNNIWYFSLKYYYLDFEDQAAYPGQDFGVFHEKEGDLQIRKGSSLVALQFSPGDPAEAAWRLLVLSCNRPAFGREPSLKSWREAYLWGINQEIMGARRNLRQIAEQIRIVATPSDSFLFSPQYRDNLLFEDSSYTTSRTYFWALQSLRIMNESITSIIDAWKVYDKSGIITPLQIQEAKQDAAASTVAALVRDIERQMEQLGEMIGMNIRRQEEIRALRDGLFNASAVLEARTAVTQGQNIRILTIVSMVFLPIGFCTSIFGMQILPKSVNLITLGIVLLAICVPTYGVIFGLASGWGGKVGRWVRGRGGEGKGDLEGGGRRDDRAGIWSASRKRGS